MAKVFLSLVLLLSISCESDQSDTSNKTEIRRISVLLLSYNLNDLNTVKEFENQMPNFNFKIRSALVNDPSVAELDTFDVVFFFSKGFDEVRTQAIGDTLYKYVNNGGKLILADFHANTQAAEGFGNLGQINPVITTDIDKIIIHNDTVIPVNKDHKILDGIDTLVTKFGGGSDSLKLGSTLLATWKNGDILAASYENVGLVLYISAFPPELNYESILNDLENYVSIKNFFRLWANAIRFVFSQKVLEEDLVYVKPGS